jgi:hypothetical protein
VNALLAPSHRVYRADQHVGEFLGQWIHSLAAAAQEPFWTTGARRQFPLGLLGITSCLPVIRPPSATLKWSFQLPRTRLPKKTARFQLSGKRLLGTEATRTRPFNFSHLAEQMVKEPFLFHCNNDQREVILKISVTETDHLFTDCNQQFGGAQCNVATAQLKQSSLSKFLFIRIHCFG